MSSSTSDVSARLEKEGRAYQHPAVIPAAAEVGPLEGWEIHRIDDRTSTVARRRTTRPIRD